MTNPSLSFVKGSFAAVILGSLFTLVWLTVLKAPALGTVADLMGSAAPRWGSDVGAQSIRLRY